MYGDRFPKGYEKIKLIGKGSKSMVWAANSKNDGRVAIKQFAKINGKFDKSVENELAFSRTLIPDIVNSSDALRESHFE